MLKKISSMIFSPFFDQCEKELEKEIIGSCDSVLDVGCGTNSPIRGFSNKISRAVGVDAYAPSIERSRRAGIHREYYQIDVLEIGNRFVPGSYDAVLLLDLVEHLPKPDGLRLIGMAERIAKKKVIIFTPNGFLKQGEVDENPYQVHRSGWEAKELEGLGYKVRGINGWKPLRTEEARIAWRPAFFWGKISLLTQLLVTGRPAVAFQILGVKNI